MPLSPDPTEWNSIHAKELREFLESPTGRLAIAWVAQRCPELLDGADVNKTLVASGAVKGFQLALNELFSLTKEQPLEAGKETPDFPDLDDDSKWPKTLGGTQ